MLLPKTIAQIQISPFNRSRGDRFSIHSGHLMTFPTARTISDEEVEDVYCDHCPIYEYNVETVNKPEGDARRRLIRCAGQAVRAKQLGPIHLSNRCTRRDLTRLFTNDDATPCGIYLPTLIDVLESPKVGMLDGVIRIGEI